MMYKRYFSQDGKTAVHFAVINKNIEALVALVTYGANINMLDEVRCY